MSCGVVTITAPTTVVIVVLVVVVVVVAAPVLVVHEVVKCDIQHSSALNTEQTFCQLKPLKKVYNYSWENVSEL